MAQSRVAHLDTVERWALLVRRQLKSSVCWFHASTRHWVGIVDGDDAPLDAVCSGSVASSLQQRVSR